MKVKDILEQLKDADPNTEVTFQMFEGCCGDTVFLEDAELDVIEKFKTYPERVFFTFSNLPGYSSCGKAGKMNKLAKELEKK